MSELSAEAEREIRNFLENRAVQEDERQRRFLNRVLQVSGLVLGAIIAGLTGAFYFFIDSVENKAIAEARTVALETVESSIGTTDQIITARAEIVSAERQAEELAERAVTILGRIRETREFVNDEEAKIRALEPLFGVANKVEDLKEALANDPGFRNAIKGDVDPAPSGLIAAFASDAGLDDTAHQCPAGWSLFEAAAGRVIVGAGTAPPPLSTHQPYDRGGAETVTLSLAQIPAHTHQVSHPKVSGLGGRHGLAAAGGSGSIKSGTGKAGGNQPHDNMPPFIALYVCRKD